MKKVRKVWSAALALLLVVVLAACGGSNSGGSSSPAPSSSAPAPSESASSQAPDSGSSGGQTIKIGVIVAESGPASSLGKQEGEIARLLAKKFAEQTFGGNKIEIIIHDYETNDTNAVVQAKKLINEDKVIAIVGGSQTSTSVAIGQVAQEAKIPFFALAPLEQNQLGEYIFSMVPSNEVMLMGAIDYMKSKGITKVAWTNARDGYGQAGLPVFERLAPQHGLEIVGVEDFDAAATDMTVQLTKLRAKNPEALIVWSRPPGSGVVAKNYKSLGMTIPLIQSNASAGIAYLEQVGADAEGNLVMGTKLEVAEDLPDSDYKKMLLEFKEMFRAEYNADPTQFAGFTYDGLNMIAKAVSEGKVTPADLYEYVQTTPYSGVTGVYQNTKDNHNAISGDGVIILKASGGKWVPAE
jgi:branched-chain amino acid transport system substrate-binding protein